MGYKKVFVDKQQKAEKSSNNRSGIIHENRKKRLLNLSYQTLLRNSMLRERA